jgi:hypothetical protein
MMNELWLHCVPLPAIILLSPIGTKGLLTFVLLLCYKKLAGLIGSTDILQTGKGFGIR